MNAQDQRIYLRFDRRDFSKPLPRPAYRFQVDYMTWSVENGGPEEAGFIAEGNLEALMNLPQWLRVPVTVTDPYGGKMWWGFVNEVEIHLGGVVYTAGLDGMANRVAVRWTAESPVEGAAVTGELQTAWAQDLESQGQYGIKTQVFTIGEARQADAEAARATFLAKVKVPASKSQPGEGVERPYGVLKLRGWYQSLDWRIYSQDRGYTGNAERANGGVDYPFGQAAGTSQVEQRVTITGASAWLARYVWARIYKVGAPADNLICEIMTAASSGVVASATVAGTAFKHDAADWYIFDTATGASLTPTTNYYVRLRRSGAVDANNYYGIKVEEDALLGASQFYYWNGSAWTARTPSASAILAVYGEEATTTQMQAVTAAAGQFLAGSVILDASGVSTRMYRTGKLDALAEMRSLLEVGTSAGEKMDAWVNPDRWLTIRKRAASTSPVLLVTSTGEVKYRNGRALIGSDIPVGRWARIESLMQAGGDYGAQSVVFLTRAEWRDGKVKVWWD